MRKLAMWGSGVIALFLLQHISVAISQQQSQGTCAALQRIISGRRIQDTGDCSANVECTGFTCSGVVNSDNDPPVTNNSTYTFHPCDDPVRFTIFGEVSSLEFPIINASVAKGTSVPFTPPFFGTLHITLIPIQNGIRFGANITGQPNEPNNTLLFPLTDVPLQCGGTSVRSTAITVLLALAVTLKKINFS